MWQAVERYIREPADRLYIMFQVRSIISDFSVIIAIASMSLLDYLSGIDTPKLLVPKEFKPTWSGRDWLIPFFNENEWWTALVAVVPALLGVILIFMDQQITAVIVNRKEHKLKVMGSAVAERWIVVSE